MIDDKQKLQMHNYTIYNLENQDADNYWFSENNGNLEASTFASMMIDFLNKTIKDNLKSNIKIVMQFYQLHF